LVLLDGSPAAWLEDRGPIMTLHGALDDASGAVLALHFRPAEDLHGYAAVLDTVFTTWGLPVACYGDGTNILVRNDPHWSLEEELQGAQDPTHLGRVLRDLGIGYVRARSPQAKGRIERLWRTLQDRLVVELRLQGVTTYAAATTCLPLFLADYNRRFAHPPADPTPAWRRPPRDLPLVLSCRYTRTVARDNTVRLGPRWLQLPPGPGGRSWAGRRLELRECLDGRLVVVEARRILATQPSPGPAFVLRPRSDPTNERQRRRRAVPRPSEPDARARRAARPGSSPTAPRRGPAPTHPWHRGYDPVRLHQVRGMTPSRSS
jgi:hypothetical protein